MLTARDMTFVNARHMAGKRPKQLTTDQQVAISRELLRVERAYQALLAKFPGAGHPTD